MYEYLKNFFTNLNVKKENIYFGYAFSLVNENHANFKNMIKNCKTTGTPFSYYSIKKTVF